MKLKVLNIVSFTVEFAFEESLYNVCEGIQYVEVCISVQGQRFGLSPVIDIFTVEESALGIYILMLCYCLTHGLQFIICRK